MPSPLISGGQLYSRLVQLELVIASICWWGWWIGVRIGL